MSNLEICVCIKSVPDPRHPADGTIDPYTGVMVRQADKLGIPRVISTLDRHALEEALRIKDSREAGVTVLSMDTPAACEALRDALALGADRAILLSDPALGGADSLATARTLVSAIDRLGGFDLVLCGAWSYHGNTGQVGPQMAELLRLPHVSFAAELKFETPTRLRVRSEWEGDFVVIEVDLPALITMVETMNTPRHASMMGILQARGKQVLQWGLEGIGLQPEVVGLAGSPSRVVGSTTLESKRAGEMLTGDEGEAVRQLVQKLRQLAVL